MDYYKVLGVEKNATDDEIKRAYNRLALRYHPDKHRNKSEKEQKECEKKFVEARKAYEVLIDKKKRKEYDMYGDTSNFQGFKDFHGFKDFGFNFADLSSGFGGFGSRNFNFGEDVVFGDYMNKQKKNMPKAVEHTLKCTLDELYNGCIKKLKIKRNIDGRIIEEILQVEIKPGYKKGTKFTFENKGDKIAHNKYQDIIVILDYKDDKFTVNGNDLEIKIEIGFMDLISGFYRIIQLPGNREYKFTERDLKVVGDFNRVYGLGMPYSKGIQRMGDLKVFVSMTVPQLSDAKRQTLSKYI